MKYTNAKITPKKGTALIVLLLMLMITTSFSIVGCGESSVMDYQNSVSSLSGSGDNKQTKDYDSTKIRLDLGIKYKSENLTDSRMLESNVGFTFKHIVSVSKVLQPGEELNLDELQESGIFAVYLRSDGSFTLSNSDGMAFSSKTVLMEKCSFKDLKIKNELQETIKVTGIVAGE